MFLLQYLILVSYNPGTTLLRWVELVTYSDGVANKVNVLEGCEKTSDSSGVGLVIYQKPTSTSCYEQRNENDPPICDEKKKRNNSWYFLEILLICLYPFILTATG